jgi:hypothetical protein
MKKRIDLFADRTATRLPILNKIPTFLRQAVRYFSSKGSDDETLEPARFASGRFGLSPSPELTAGRRAERAGLETPAFPWRANLINLLVWTAEQKC